MAEKNCSKCNARKPLSEFNFANKKLGTYRADCKECRKIYVATYRIINAEKVKAQDKKYYNKNKGKKLAQKKVYYKKNKATIRATQKEHYWNTRDWQLHRKKVYYLKNREKIIRKVRERYASDHHYKIMVCMRRRTRDYMRGHAKYRDVIQCSHSFLLRWFEFNFGIDTEWGMSWDNYGTCWQIDHVYPLAKTRGMTPAEQCQYFSWKNLRPVDRNYNSKKFDKIIETDIDLINKRVADFILLYPDEFETIYPVELIDGEEFINDLEEPNEYENVFITSVLDPTDSYGPPKVEDLPTGTILITNPDGTTLELINDLEDE